MTGEGPPGTGPLGGFTSTAGTFGPRRRSISPAQPARAVRLLAVLERDGPTCIWCGRAFAAHVAPTTEHVVPRVEGGPSRLENEVAACGRCNGERAQPYLDAQLRRLRRRAVAGRSRPRVEP